MQNSKRTVLLDRLELLVVPDQQRAREAESVDGDRLERFLGARDEQHPLARDEQIVRGGPVLGLGVRVVQQVDGTKQRDVEIARGFRRLGARGILHCFPTIVVDLLWEFRET